MTTQNKAITIIGAGYVGLSTAALFSNTEYDVRLIDINTSRLDAIKNGKSFFYEEGIDQLIEKAVRRKKLKPTNDYKEGVNGADIVFSCVGTPDNPDGSSNLTYVFKAAEEAATHMKPGVIYVQKSTVPVGTGQEVQRIFKKSGVDISYVSNPEFLREGTAIQDALWFDRIVCGSTNRKAIDKVFEIYKTLEKRRILVARTAGLKAPKNYIEGSYVATSLESAELIKVTANAFLALKISFANSIAKLADHVGADVMEVMDAVGQDQRIGRAFLNAGRGYGGGCFPKDMSGLIDAMNEHGADSQILTAAQDINQSMPGYVVKKTQDALGELKDKRVAVLGLSFKSGTSDSRRSPAVSIANILAKSGAHVSAYDPQANGEAREDLRSNIAVKDTAFDAARDTDAIIIATDWPEFKSLNFSKLRNIMRDNIIIDAMNCLDISEVDGHRLQYIGVGRTGEKL